MPGPGSYDANKEKGHNDLPKWRSSSINTVLKKEYNMEAASKICLLRLDQVNTKASKVLYDHFYLEKAQRDDNFDKGGKI